MEVFPKLTKGAIKRAFDNRGYFQELYIFGENSDFREGQVNHSRSKKGVIRGLHFNTTAVKKRVYCLRGEIMGCAININTKSNGFGAINYYSLSEEENKFVDIPPLYAHGFQVLSEFADIIYLTSKRYNHEDDFNLNPLDTSLAIQWKIHPPILSERDANARSWLSFVSEHE